MPIFRGSRYQGQRFTALVEDDGTEKRFMHLRTDTVSLEDVGQSFKLFRRRSPEELLDGIAFDEYAKSRLQWVLAEVNDMKSYWELEELDSIILPSKEFMADF